MRSFKDDKAIFPASSSDLMHSIAFEIKRGKTEVNLFNSRSSWIVERKIVKDLKAQTLISTY